MTVCSAQNGHERIHPGVDIGLLLHRFTLLVSMSKIPFMEPAIEWTIVI